MAALTLDRPAETPTTDPDLPASRAERARETEDLLDEARTAEGSRRHHLLDRVILLNRGVAEAVASRYARRGIPYEDLRQAAYVGLTKAVHRFDPERSDDLLSYAVPTIRGELQRHFRDLGWTIRPPRRVQELQWHVHACADDLVQELGREPSETEVQERLDVSQDEYAAAMAASGCFHPTSLDLPVGDDSSVTLGELLPDDRADGLGAADARTALAPVVRQLPPRDQRIIYLRFFEDRTQEQIGRELGVTQMQVSRLLARILERLRSQLT